MPTPNTEWNRPRYVSVTTFQDAFWEQIQDVNSEDIYVIWGSWAWDLVLKVATIWEKH